MKNIRTHGFRNPYAGILSSVGKRQQHFRPKQEQKTKPIEIKEKLEVPESDTVEVKTLEDVDELCSIMRTQITEYGKFNVTFNWEPVDDNKA